MKNQEAIVHTKQFTVDKAIIRHHILSQAGSVYKAIMELCMNDIDALASEIQINIEDDLKTIVVQGNGIGFTSMDEVETLFGCFGFDHESEKEKSRGRQFGRFGMGRGQIFGFGKSTWRTNHFEMAVDLKDPTPDEMPYTVTEHTEVIFKGCQISIELYEAMQIWERRQLESELKQVMKYVNVNIQLNGKLINQHPDTVKWSVLEGNIAFKMAPPGSDSGLRVYNLGMYIRTYSHSHFGVSGDLSSIGKTFDLNVARNDITQNRCPLWKKIRPLLQPFAEKRKKTSLTRGDRQYTIGRILSGDLGVKEFQKLKLFTLINGTEVVLNKLLSHAASVITVAGSNHSQVGETIHSLKLACVLSPNTLGLMNVDTVDEMITGLSDGLREYCEKNGHRSFNRDGKKGYWSVEGTLIDNLDEIELVDFDTLALDINNRNELIKDSELTKLEKCKLKAITSMANQIHSIVRATVRSSFGDTEARSLTKRKLIVGESESALAWTDSNSYIAINRKSLTTAFTGGTDGLLYIFNILVHEYCHTESSMGDHVHGDEFNNLFREVIESKEYRPTAIIQNTAHMYFNTRKRLELGQSQGELLRFKNTFQENIISFIN